MLKALATSLLILFLADVVGLTLFMFMDWYKIRREIKHMFKSREADRQSTTFEFSTDEFKELTWVEKNKEFILHEKLYDILHVKKSHGRMIITCYEDHKEASFFKNLQLGIHQHSNEGTRNAAIALNLFKFLSSLAFQDLPVVSVQHDEVLILPHAYTNGYHSPDAIPLSHPPEVS